jgi:hypothetical protein
VSSTDRPQHPEAPARGSDGGLGDGARDITERFAAPDEPPSLVGDSRGVDLTEEAQLAELVAPADAAQ